jgi:hypothetical protein
MPGVVREEAINWPLWWFVRLEKAVEQGDHAAAEAQRELERLGVRVRYGRPRQSDLAAEVRGDE